MARPSGDASGALGRPAPKLVLESVNSRGRKPPFNVLALAFGSMFWNRNRAARRRGLVLFNLLRRLFAAAAAAKARGRTNEGEPRHNTPRPALVSLQMCAHAFGS